MIVDLDVGHLRGMGHYLHAAWNGLRTGIHFSCCTVRWTYGLRENRRTDEDICPYVVRGAAYRINSNNVDADFFRHPRQHRIQPSLQP